MKSKPFNLKNKIIRTFSLFEGKRKPEENRRILNKVYLLCLDEMAQYLEESLPSDQKQNLTRQIESLKDNDYENFAHIIAEIDQKLKKIEDAKFKLIRRLNAFINNLHYQALKKK